MAISVTRPKFDFSQFPKYYFDNNPLTTHVLTSLSATFPPGEQFFVNAVRNFREKLERSDPFQKDISGFIGQEAMHSLAHNLFNEAASRNGIPVDYLERGTERLLSLVEKVLPERLQLAATVCLEHYTAIMAGKLLTDDWFNSKFQGELRNLWLWHAQEEAEHAHVAWDLYHKEEVGGTYLERSLMMIPVTVVFFAAIAHMTAIILAVDKPKKVDYITGFKYLLGRRGFFSSLIPDYLKFFNPKFHPNDHTRGVLNHVVNTSWAKSYSSSPTLKAQVA